jgi:hypothetical protein
MFDLLPTDMSMFDNVVINFFFQIVHVMRVTDEENVQQHFPYATNADMGSFLMNQRRCLFSLVAGN